MTAVKFVSCLSDSAYQAANPELMAGHRFAVAGGNAASRPVSVAPTLQQRIYGDLVIEAARYGDPATQTDQPTITVGQRVNTRPEYYYSGR